MKRKTILATLLLMLLMIVAPCFLGGCSPRVIEKIVRETDTVRTVDSIIVKSRPDTVKVEIPSSSQSIVTNDTTSHLEDDLYESDAYWDGQFLHHSLNSKPGAHLTKEVVVHDTIKVKEKEESHNKESKEKETIYVQPTLKDKIVYVGYGLGIGLIILLLYVFRKKIVRIYEAIGL